MSKILGPTDMTQNVQRLKIKLELFEEAYQVYLIFLVLLEFSLNGVEFSFNSVNSANSVDLINQ